MAFINKNVVFFKSSQKYYIWVIFLNFHPQKRALKGPKIIKNVDCVRLALLHNYTAN